MGEYIVYVHTTPNGKKYVGITKNKTSVRWQNGNGYHTQVFYNAIKKYGWENITHEIVYSNLEKEVAEQRETELIAKYKSNNPRFGYNIANGGNAKGRVSKHTKEIMSALHKGENNPFYGKKHTKKTRQIIAMKSSMRKHTDEEKRKIAEANRRRIITDETRKKLSESRKGIKLKPLTKEAKEKVSIATSKAIKCIETGKIYRSITQASIELNCQFSGIAMACRGERKTAQGYHWEFIKK